jgi:hypothetical protein
MTVYQVREWDDHYENNKSRERDECSFVCVPNKQHGLGFLRLMSLPDGASIYGIFNLIIGACSRQRRPRNGWLTDDGTETGIPWTVDDLAMCWRRTAGEIERAMNTLCSKPIGWMDAFEFETVSSDVASRKCGVRVVPGECPPNTPEWKEGNEEKEGCTEPPAASVPPDPVLLQFPVTHRKGESTHWPFTRGNLTDLSSTFPALDVLAESRKALGWVNSNPHRKKTARGMSKFLFGWMSRAQDRGGVRLSDEPKSSETGFVEAPWTKEQADAIGAPWPIPLPDGTTVGA